MRKYTIIFKGNKGIYREISNMMIRLDFSVSGIYQKYKIEITCKKAFTKTQLNQVKQFLKNDGWDIYDIKCTEEVNI